MDEHAEMAARHKANLAELAQMGMELARDLKALASAAPDRETAAELALAFQRASRSARQSMALEAKLARDHLAFMREERQVQLRETLKRVQAKRRQVRTAISPLIWTEADGDEEAAEPYFDALEALFMRDDEVTEAFVAEPLEACVERLAAELGLAADVLSRARASNDAPAADENAAVQARRSSG